MFKKISTAASLILSLALVGCAADADTLGQHSAAATSGIQFELFEDAGGEMRFNLLASNHEVILVSEGYENRTGALGGILAVLRAGTTPANFDVLEAKDGQFYFNLVAGNGEIIGTGETYVSKSNAKRGVAAVVDAVTLYNRFHARHQFGFKRFIGEDGQHYFHLKAFNGEIVLASEGYTSEAGALNGAVAAGELGADIANYDLWESVDGQFYFTLAAANGEIVAVSETYVSLSNAERAIDSIIELLGQVSAI